MDDQQFETVISRIKAIRNLTCDFSITADLISALVPPTPSLFRRLLQRFLRVVRGFSHVEQQQQ